VSPRSGMRPVNVRNEETGRHFEVHADGRSVYERKAGGLRRVPPHDPEYESVRKAALDLLRQRAAPPSPADLARSAAGHMRRIVRADDPVTEEDDRGKTSR
jgi:hypothetical protein